MADLSGAHSLTILAPIDRCFEIAADIATAPDWQGSMKSARVIERDAEGRALLVETENDASIATVTLVLRFTYAEPVSVRWSRESGDLKGLDGSWAFEDLGDGTTRATYALDIGLNRRLSLMAKAIKGPAESKLRELLTHRPVEGLKARAERAG